MAKYCVWCGKQIGDQDKFCIHCGRRADGSDAAPPQAQTPVQGCWTVSPQQPQHQAPSPKKRGGAGRVIGIAAAVLVLLIAVGGLVWPGFFLVKPKSVTPDAKPTAVPVATEAPMEPAAPKPTAAPKPVVTPEPAPEPSPEPTPYVNPFTDVADGDWYYDAVLWAGENGIISGTEFKPNETTTRGQALTFLWRAAGSPEPKLKVSPYSDVSEDDWYDAPVRWGFENGLISSAADGQFHAANSLTRAQGITFLCRALGGKAQSAERSFADVRAGDWYFDAANWALENGVVGRDTSWSFHPDQDITRAMFVTFMHRAFVEDAKKASSDPPAGEGFRELGIDADVDSHAANTFRTETANGNPVTFTASVTDYRIFESDDAMPQREGYEWRVMTIETTTTDLDGSGLRLGLVISDYYNTRLHTASKQDEGDDMFTYTVLWGGELVDYTIWYAKNDDNSRGTAHWTFTASVPIGYDGVVVGLRNTTVKSGGRPLCDYYTGEDDFALFRMN